MAGMAVPSRGRLWRISCPVSLENAHSHWNDREGEIDSGSQAGGGSKKSLLLVLEQERGVKLEARRRRWAVTWSPLPTHHREGVVVKGRNTQ